MKITNSKGFTLIETLAAVTILSMVFIPIHFLFLETLQLNQQAKKIMLADQLAQQYMETTKYQGPFEDHEVLLEKTEGGFHSIIKVQPDKEFYTPIYQITIIVDYQGEKICQLFSWHSIEE